MAKNLKGQFIYAINNNFSERAEKYAYKQEYGQKMDSKIFSYQGKFNLKDMAGNIQTFMKTHFPEIKKVEQIKTIHMQDFLNSKMENCTQNTINTYAQNIFKLQACAEQTYKINLSWKQELVIPQVMKQQSTDRGVSSVISREDYNLILNYCKNNYSQSNQAILLQDQLGIRVEEIARIKIDNIDLDKNILTLENTKGGRVLERELTPQAVALIRESLCMEHHKERLFSINGSTINKQLGRIQDKFGLERHSNHDIRRLIAQEKYDKYRENEKTPKEAANLVSEWLNHGRGREEMLKKSYIEIW